MIHDLLAELLIDPILFY